MAKTLFINGRFLAQPLTGVQRYAIEVCKALDHQIDCGEIQTGGVEIIILVPPERISPLPLKHIAIRPVGKLKGNLWEQVELPWYARSGLLFSPCNIGPVLHFNQVVTIHDASVYAVPEAYSLSFRWKYRVIFWILGKTARHIFTDSQFSKAEIARYCRVRPERIQVVALAAEHILATAPDDGVFEKHNIGKRPFVLAVSSNSPHKNFAGVVRAIELLKDVDFEVVIAGGTFSKVFQSRAVPLPGFVRQIGYVSDSELRSLYEHAACFVYPSYYEGFGLPPLEAMTLGCPVIVSNAASLPEVCGEGAVYVHPDRPDEIARQVQHIMKDDGLRERQKPKALNQARKFSWERTVQDIWEVLRMGQ